MSYKQDKIENKTTTQTIKTTFSRFFSKYFANEIREHNSSLIKEDIFDYEKNYYIMGMKITL